jgi:HAE1 family hydrophobic/amphiphilic exporter-1
VLVGVQLPDGASLERTVSTLLLASKIAEDTPGVDQVIAIAGNSILDDSSTLANAGLAYVVFKDWSARRKVKGTVTSTATITR